MYQQPKRFRPPRGWGISASVTDKARATEIAKERRKAGKQARVARHFTSTLAGKPVTEYIVITKG